MSGGGAKGAYQNGAIWQMVRTLPPMDVRYQVMSGVSAGAINAGGYGLFAVGDELNASQFMVDTWQSLNTSNLWKWWPKGPVDSLFFKSGLLDSSPMYEFCDKIVAGRHI